MFTIDRIYDYKLYMINYQTLESGLLMQSRQGGEKLSLFLLTCGGAILLLCAVYRIQQQKMQEQEKSHTIGQSLCSLVFHWLAELPRHWGEETAPLLSLVWVRVFLYLHKTTLNEEYKEKRKHSTYITCVFPDQVSPAGLGLVSEANKVRTKS